jgi:energy-coupling factor transporter ATP-binding protein EcfA2
LAVGEVSLVEDAMHIAKIEVSGIRSFRGDRVVDLDLTRPDGSLAGWTVIAGRNGSGKSTLLQAIALVLAGPRATGLVSSLSDWMSEDAMRAEITATVRASKFDSYEDTLFDVPGGVRRLWLRLNRSGTFRNHEPDAIDPDADGEGVNTLISATRARAEGTYSPGWFYAGYGPFRHLGGSGNWKLPRNRSASRPPQISSLFDESVSLTDAVDWLIEQHLYQLEQRSGAADLIEIAMTLLADGLLPDDFQVCRVDSDGLWVSHRGSEFPLREMSDGYRAVTALIVDIVRQMQLAYGELKITPRHGVPSLAYPGVVLIDEVDTHLHVSWQKVLGTWMKEHFPELQFIVTSHSPYICQSADPGGLILLPGPDDQRPAQVVDQDLYERVVYGSGDDAVLTDLFGISTPYSDEAVKLRSRLGDLELKVLNGSATESEISEYRELSQTLTSSLATRATEILTRLENQSDSD